MAARGSGFSLDPIRTQGRRPRGAARGEADKEPLASSCPSPPASPTFFLFYHLLWVATLCPPPSLVPFLALLLPPTLLGPLSVNKAQGALPLGRRALSPLSASPIYSLGSPFPHPHPNPKPAMPMPSRASLTERKTGDRRGGGTCERRGDRRGEGTGGELARGQAIGEARGRATGGTQGRAQGWATTCCSIHQATSCSLPTSFYPHPPILFPRAADKRLQADADCDKKGHQRG